MQNRKGSTLAIMLIGVSLAFGGYVLFSRLNSRTSITESVKEISVFNDVVQTQPTPTPFLFAETTIPTLRNKDYQSEIDELTLFSENSNYKAYTTSYNSDGLKINAYLTIPQSVRPQNGYPAIVFVHGYIPPTLYKTTENYNSYVDYFARNGFLVLKIDLRGHGNSEGIPSGAYYSGDYVIDTLNAVSALSTFDDVNPEAIGLWGHSMAGNVTFRAFVASDRVKALVIWAGAVYTYEDMQEYGIDDNSYRPPDDGSERQKQIEAFRNAHGTFSRDSEFWRQVVPTNYLDGINRSVQIHHAIDDSVVSVEYSRNLVSILKSANIKHELFEYQSGGHNLTGTSFTQAMQRSVEFFKEELR